MESVVTMNFSIILLCIVFTCSSVSAQTKPGFKTRITTSGLNYVDTVAIEILSGLVIGKTIPDQHGSDGPVHYSLSGLTVASFSKPSSSISFVPPQGLKWRGSGAVLSMRGHFHWSMLFVSDGGTFDVTVSGVSFNLGVILSSDTNGRPHIKSNGCGCSIGSISISFHGDVLAQVLNLFKSLIESNVRSNLQGTLCGVINSAINSDAEKALSTLPVTVDIAGVYMLDYRLLSNPDFTTDYMETFHKGEIFWEKNATEAPFSANVLPPYNDTSNMMYVWVSDYIVNSMSYQAQQHGALVYNLTAQDLPAANRNALNTTCNGLLSLCIGNFIPALHNEYPGCTTELHMSSSPAPNLHVTNGMLLATMGGLINVYAKDWKTNKLSPLLFTLHATATASANVSLKNETIFAKVNKLSIDCVVVNSSLKEKVSGKAIEFLVNNALILFVEPQLNALGAKGLPIPITDGVSFVNSKLVYLQDTLVIATDLHYQKSTSKAKETEWINRNWKQYAVKTNKHVIWN